MTQYTDLCARLERADEYEPLGHDAWEAAAAIRELEAERDVGNACNRGLVRLNESTLARAESAEAKVAELTADYKTASDQADDLAAKLDNAEDKASKDAKAHEKEIAVWSENYAALEQKVQELVAALREIDALDPEVGHIGACSENAIRGLVLRMGSIARTAIRKGGEG